MLTFVAALFAAPRIITLDADATQVAHSQIRVTLSIPATPGRLSLEYPKWIPAHHRPNGPINDVMDLHFTAGGKELTWQRDDVDMFGFHVDVPGGVQQVQASFAYRFQPRTIGSPHLSRIKWNRLLLYPKGTIVENSDVQVVASITVPKNWKFATALPLETQSGDKVSFKPATVARLVDSPMVVGANYKKVEVPGQQRPHYLDFFAEQPAGIAAVPDDIGTKYARLVEEAQALFGAQHYREYHWLITMSSLGGGEGTEHGESSEDGTGSNPFATPEAEVGLAGLLGHEYAHSWDGKYRRPAGLATPDFQEPMKGELLWVYEGMTQYLGKLLPTRAGLQSAEAFRDDVAAIYNSLDHRPGRRWRSLADTARSVQLVRDAPATWFGMRRGTDYYDEAVLIWLDADMTIRRLSGGAQSLDNFCRAFFGGESGMPGVKPYTLAELEAALNAVQPFNWHQFFVERVYTPTVHPPMGGIEGAGWKFVLDANPASGRGRRGGSLFNTIGASVAPTGVVTDVDPYIGAGEAGVAPGMTIKTVNGHPWSTTAINDALEAGGQITLVTDNAGDEETFTFTYKPAATNPHLERDATKPDLLEKLTAPLAHE